MRKIGRRFITRHELSAYVKTTSPSRYLVDAVAMTGGPGRGTVIAVGPANLGEADANGWRQLTRSFTWGPIGRQRVARPRMARPIPVTDDLTYNM